MQRTEGACNRAKSDKTEPPTIKRSGSLVRPDVPRTWVTERTW